MSTADVPPAHPGLPPAIGATPVPHEAVAWDRRLHSAQRWAGGVLTTATLVLVAYLAMVAAAAGLAAWVLDVVRPGTASLDLSSLVVDALPGLLVGWCTGLAATTVLVRGDALGPRMAGVASGTLGVVLGALVLRFAGLL